MKSLEGHFLVAAPHQLDPNFAGAVVPVVRHADRGAFGLIVNCPRDLRAGTWRQPSARPRRPGRPRLYFGGPVRGPLMAVHADGSLAEIEVLPGVFFAGTAENVRALVRNREQPCKVFRGYAGWGPGQLEHEVEYGVWRAVPATAAKIFASADGLWDGLLRQAFDALLQVLCNSEDIPSDASLN